MNRREILAALAATPLLAGRSLLAEGIALHTDATAGCLAKHELATAGAAADRILPATTTPGALAAGVDLFIDRFLATEDEPARARFREGLREMNRRALAASGVLFHHLPAGEQDLGLTVASKELPAFFEDLRSLTVYGYYTSKIGMEQETGFAILPGVYAGCTHPEHGGKK